MLLCQSWLKSFKIISFSSSCLAVLTVSIAVCGAEPDSSAPKVELVAPGIWHIRFGSPEEFTPDHFRSAPIDTAALDTMSSDLSPPFDPAKIVFDVSDRGCSLR